MVKDPTNTESKLKIDDERFVDLSDYTQVLYLLFPLILLEEIR